jgi:hypothetical protein
MATSGYIDVKATTYNTVRFAWERTSSNITTNKSVVKWTLSLIAGSNGYISSSEKKYWSVVINGTGYNGSNYIGINNNETKTLATGSTTIPHNADGTKTFSFSFAQDFNITFAGSNVGTIRGSGTGVLNTIPKAPTILTAPDFTDADNPTITYSNPAGTGAEQLKACISWTGADDIAYRDIDKNGSSYTFELTSAERTKLCNAIENGASMPVTFYVTAWFNGVPKYSTLKKTFTLNNAFPTITSFTVKDTNSTTKALTGNENIWIKGKSTLTYALSATCRQDATITDYEISCGDAIRFTTNGTFYGPTQGTVWALVADSRGNATNTSKSATTFVPYSPVTCGINGVKATASGTSGSITFNITGNYYNGSFGATNNTLTVQYRYKAEGGSYSSWITVSPTISTGGYSHKVTISGTDYQKSYTIQAQASDKLVAVSTSELPVAKAEPIFDWSKSDFNFNVPVTIQGNALNDYVIETGTEEMGTNGTWYWSKWKSGRAECYGCRNYGNMAVSTAWGSLYKSSTFGQDLPSGLFATKPEVMNIQIREAGADCWITSRIGWAPDATTTGGFAVTSPVSGTISQVYISFNVIGRWK